MASWCGVGFVDSAHVEVLACASVLSLDAPLPAWVT